MSTATLDADRRRTQKSIRASELPTTPNIPTTTQAKSRSSWISRCHFFFRNFSVEHSFTLFGFLGALAIVGLFSVDLVWGWPFFKASPIANVLFILCGICLLCMCIDVFRAQTRQHALRLRRERNRKRFERSSL